MLISVVLPTYERPAMALECVESILRNDHAEYEVLIVDQGPDRTLERELIGRYGMTPRIRYFYLRPPGVSRARNLGLHEAHGEIVAFIDDDALADPHWLRGIARTFAEIDPRPALMGGRIRPIWPFPKPRWYPAEREFLLGMYDSGDSARPFPERDLPMSGNMAGVRKVIIDIGGFDESLGPDRSRPGTVLVGEDSMLGQRMRDAGHLIYYQPAALVRHRIFESKLRPMSFLRRHFLEGVTVAARMKLMARPDSMVSASILSRYLLAAAVAIRRGPLSLDRAQSKRPLSATAMLALSRISYGFGTVYGAAKFKTKGSHHG
jgi:glycosyltransferase involved in cell wall biosynthesis